MKANDFIAGAAFSAAFRATTDSRPSGNSLLNAHYHIAQRLLAAARSESSDSRGSLLPGGVDAEPRLTVAGSTGRSLATAWNSPSAPAGANPMCASHGMNRIDHDAEG